MPATARFIAMGTTTTVVVQDPDLLPDALAAVEHVVREVDRVCSRFRDDSEISALNRGAGGPPVRVSPLLEEAIAAALDAAAMTGGLVDPTVGGCLEDIGYSVTFGEMGLDGPPLMVRVRRAPGWRSVSHDPATHTVALPAGTTLDLGASGKAWAADRAAAAAHQRLGAGVAVDCGGDLAVCGPPPPGGWPVRASEHPEDPVFDDIHVFDGGVATSGVGLRTWRRGARTMHHIVDPATGRPAGGPWRTVTVAARSCLEANAAATAALVMGRGAAEWLDALRLPARLVDRAGRVRHTAAWPASTRRVM